MNQASRIIANIAGRETAKDVLSAERIACGAWKRAVGTRLAEKTRAAKLVRTTLVVEVEDEIWQRQLWGLRGHILRNLRAAIGPELVEELEFRVIPARREPARERQHSSPLFQKVRQTVPDDAEGIRDAGLRRIYRAARRRETA